MQWNNSQAMEKTKIKWKGWFFFKGLKSTKLIGRLVKYKKEKTKTSNK